MELFNRMTKFAISPDESIAKMDQAKTKNRIELRLTRGFLLSRKEPRAFAPSGLGIPKPAGKADNSSPPLRFRSGTVEFWL